MTIAWKSLCLGNFIVIFTVVNTKSLHNTTNRYLVSVALGELDILYQWIWRITFILAYNPYVRSASGLIFWHLLWRVWWPIQRFSLLTYVYLIFESLVESRFTAHNQQYCRPIANYQIMQLLALHLHIWFCWFFCRMYTAEWN